tara:strand:+ start:440 stop:595 length:156 start_codon:yes stop_codon:yes gene_type:complete
MDEDTFNEEYKQIIKDMLNNQLTIDPILLDEEAFDEFIKKCNEQGKLDVYF